MDAYRIKAFFTFKPLYRFTVFMFVIIFMPIEKLRMFLRQFLISCEIIEFHSAQTMNVDITYKLLFASLNKAWN